MSRIAVVLFNLGGPDSLKAVAPFLRNLFSDRAIIRLPTPARQLAAMAISGLRVGAAKANYAYMGGASPLNRETEAQRAALERVLRARRPADEVRVVVAMRYWRPATAAAAAEVAAFEPDQIVLLPLYPQFSTTTTASSFGAWEQSYRGGGRINAVCCYFDAPALVEAHANRIQRAWVEAGSPARVRLLFSAHGLPESIARAGDPYRWQIEQTCKAVAARLGGGWDWRVCYQSRIGPVRWIGPSTEEEIRTAGAEGLGVVIDPVAFVSEHIETLVELDRDYARVAQRAGAAPYVRVPALGADQSFIDALADIAQRALARTGTSPGWSPCAGGLGRCPQARRAAA